MFSFLKRLNSPLPISGMHPARWLGWRHPRPREPGRSKTNSMILGHNCSCETAAVGMPRIHLPRKKSLLLFNVLMHISYNYMICIYIYIYLSLSLLHVLCVCDTGLDRIKRPSQLDPLGISGKHCLLWQWRIPSSKTCLIGQVVRTWASG